MRANRIYRAAQQLYPEDYRMRFGGEMYAAFAAAARDARQGGTRGYVIFLMAEVLGLSVGACREWLVKLGADPTMRARILPDCRRMRPAGVTRAEWTAGLDDVR